MSYILAFAGFATLIVLHEFGHFAVAKAVGMRVERFSLFFGPLVLKWRRGETEYGVGVIPLGGYVRITGMNPREFETAIVELEAQLAGVEAAIEDPAVTRASAGRELAERAAAQRGRLTALRKTERILDLPADLPSRPLRTAPGAPIGERRAAIADVLSKVELRIAELEAITPRSYFRQPVWKRIAVIVAGPLVNVVIAFAIFWGYFLGHGQVDVTRKVEVVSRSTPAAQVLRPGDEILAVDGQRGPVTTLSRYIRRHHCPGFAQVPGCLAATPVTLEVRRAGRLLEIKSRPRYDAKVKAMRLGFAFGFLTQPTSADDAARRSLDQMWFVTSKTVTTIAQLFYNENARKQVSGVVYSYDATRKSFSQDTTRALLVLGLISLSLAIINLFPFLPLDGGHIFWAVAEKVRRRPIPFHVMERAGAVGFVLIIMLFVIGLSNDIGRLSNPVR